MARPPQMTYYEKEYRQSRLPSSTYYDEKYRQSASLIRARRPYLIKNALTGITLFAFTIGVYAFTINAVGQDDFEDVVVPAAQTPEGARTATSGPVVR